MAVVPPEEGTLLSGGASVKSARLLPGSLSYHPEGSVMDVSSGSPGTVVTFLRQEVLLADATISLHPFFMHQLDFGPIRLTTIAHAFNYRVAVLRDGVKSAARVGRSRRAGFWRTLVSRGDIRSLSCFRWCVHSRWKCPRFYIILRACMVCRLMLVCPVNHRDIQNIPVGIVRVSLRTAWALMFTTYHRQPRRLRLWKNGRTCLPLLVGMVRG